MRITVIYATQRTSKSSTYNIAQQFIRNLSDKDDVREFFLPKDMPEFCIGCWNCFTDYRKCPHYGYLKPILESMLEADLLIFTAPVYVYHVPGQVKAFLDHFGYQWMAHQPRKEMFHKQALLISTAAGAGTRSALRDLRDSMTFWGISRIHTLGRNVYASDWDTVDDKRKLKLQKEIDRLSARIKETGRHVTPSLKVRALFYTMRFMQKRFKFNPADVQYWESLGWFEKERPW
ncbi:flavodoxin family protein [Lacrimispora brassicae]